MAPTVAPEDELRLGTFATQFCSVVDRMLSRPGSLFDRGLQGQLVRLLEEEGGDAAGLYERLLHQLVVLDARLPAAQSPSTPPTSAVAK